MNWLDPFTTFPAAGGSPITDNNVQTATIDTATDFGFTGYTAPAGTNRCMLAIITLYQADNSGGNLSTFSSATFGGNVMTEAIQNILFSSFDSMVSVFYLLDANIPSGSQNLVMSPTHNAQEGHVVLLTADNVDQTTPLDVTPTSADLANDSSPQLAITPVTDGARIYCQTPYNVFSAPGATAVPDVGDEHLDATVGSETSGHVCAFTKDPAGAQTMGFTMSKAGSFVAIADVALRPA